MDTHGDGSFVLYPCLSVLLSSRVFASCANCFTTSEHKRRRIFSLHSLAEKPAALPEDSRSSTVRGVLRYAGSEFLWFPLTLTLSRWEREQQSNPLRSIKRA